MFGPYLALWRLEPDGEPIVTHSSRLLPVRRDGQRLMLKLAIDAEEKAGAALMAWWNGNGAAPVLAAAGDALLLERAVGRRCLADWSRNGRDDEASQVLCAVAQRLHAPRPDALPPLVPLPARFADLAASARNGILALSAATASELLSSPQDVRVLHGDLHHGNVLDFGEHGWLAIDPKGLIGERGFDYANIFCNPDHAVATRLFEPRLDCVSAAAGLDKRRLLRWVLAWCGLSAVWSLQVGESAATALAVAELAAAKLQQ